VVCDCDGAAKLLLPLLLKVGDGSCCCGDGCCTACTGEDSSDCIIFGSGSGSGSGADTDAGTDAGADAGTDAIAGARKGI
jgi:hypothetical protein